MNAMSGFSLNVFTPEQVRSLHYASLEVLREAGLKVESPEAVKLFGDAGARIVPREHYHMVYLPDYLVEDCIRWAPKNFILHGRDPQHDFLLEPHRVGFSTFGESIQIIDIKSRAVRKTTKADLASAALLCDYLDELAIVERAVGSLDQCPATQPMHNYEAMVANTAKHAFLGFNDQGNAEQIIKMAKICSGGKKTFSRGPIVSAIVCPTSPLTLVKNCCDVVLTCARAGVGMVIIPMALCGATATVTLAGTLIAHNAETLGVLALAQLAAKGTPCIYGSCTTIMDLRTGAPSLGAPEYGMIGAGLTRLAQYYQIPNWVGGGHSDSKLPDAQAAYEATLTAATSALAGANIVYGFGHLEQGLTYDHAKMVMDAEMISNLQHVIGGIPVTDETMAVDVIKEIGAGGEFLTHEHTYRHMKEMSRFRLFDRNNRASWMAATEGRDLTERAYAEAQRILSTHTPLALPDGASREIRGIVCDYENTRKNPNQPC